MIIRNATALVTGANRGIGRALVHALVLGGAKKVYATARNLDSLSETVSFDRTHIVPLQLDVTDHAAVSALPAQAGDVTLLVNNAGVLDFGGILDAPLEAARRNLDVNFFGTLVMARAFAPVIEANGGGGIVNILTLVALASMPGLAVYNASKAAALSMTQSLRASLSGKRIDVVNVFPGAVDTDMIAAITIPKANPADVASAVVAGIVAGHEDIFPDAMSAQYYAAWKQDHKAVEKQFAAM